LRVAEQGSVVKSFLGVIEKEETRMANLVLKRVGVLSIAKIEALIMAVFGLLYGLLYGLFMGAIAAMMPASSGGAAVGGIGILAVFIFPIMFAVMGFIGGALGAVIYNFAAGFIGGIELELENATPNYGVPPPQNYGAPPPPPQSYGAPYGPPPR
jgi:hypothetical protein